MDLSTQSPLVRLQFLLSKSKLTSADKSNAQDLLDSVTDWNELAASSLRNFGMPLLRRNLMCLERSRMPAEIWETINDHANSIAFHNMRLVSAMKHFTTRCLAPLGIEGIYFKGVTMASQYYPDVGLRPCRDIDVLVPKDTLSQVANTALDEGYTLMTGDAKALCANRNRDIKAALRYGGGITLVLPEQRVVIDLQDKLDKFSGIFNGYDPFENTKAVSLAGSKFKTMQPDFLFNYLCHHHTRHTWSNLHWISDLDALITSDQFSRADTLHLAKDLGQLGTVEASFELHELLSDVTRWDNSDNLARGKEFLRLAIRNLGGKLSLEKKISLGMIGGEFMFPWQASPDLLLSARRRWWRNIFRPTLTQYANMPLPEQIQFLYYAPRALELAQQQVVRSWGKRR